VLESIPVSGSSCIGQFSNSIIALRCCKLSGRFEDFWERRATPLKANTVHLKHFCDILF